MPSSSTTERIGMYRVIVTVDTSSRATAEQVAEIIRNLFALTTLSVGAEVEAE